MACFIQSLLPYAYLLPLWPAFGLLAKDVAKAKGATSINIKQYLCMGPFAYLGALGMPDFKSQLYLRKIAERYSLESELQAALTSPKHASYQMNRR